MTKVISLSEKAYTTLKGMKKSGESFSDVVLRVAGERNKKSILEFAGTWKGNDIDEVFSIVLKDREQAKSREIEF
ncbi:antitoxin VapB family protein [Candidatus Bathyarchaeota archaeon]|nr:antitoxin VapB family protein [Candidatus Bathyarchaeota archaeon]